MIWAVPSAPPCHRRSRPAPATAAVCGERLSPPKSSYRRSGWKWDVPEGASNIRASIQRSAGYNVLKQHHEVPEREANRCLARAAVPVCVWDDLMPDRLLPGRREPVTFRVARDCPPGHTAGIRYAADHYRRQCAHMRADVSAPCKGDHIHDYRCSDRHCPHS